MGNGTSHSVNVRDKLAFLHRMMTELAGNAHMSLEGDLSVCKLGEDLFAKPEETLVLRRNTVTPKQDFVVLKLTPENVSTILKQVTAAGLNRRIIHVQIERDGKLELGAYDNFHPDCVVAGPRISAGLLGELKKSNVVGDYKVASSRR